MVARADAGIPRKCLSIRSPPSLLNRLVAATSAPSPVELMKVTSLKSRTTDLAPESIAELMVATNKSADDRSISPTSPRAIIPLELSPLVMDNELTAELLSSWLAPMHVAPTQGACLALTHAREHRWKAPGYLAKLPALHEHLLGCG